jgi:hypothetical protein
MKYPIIIFIEDNLSYQQFFKPSIIFKEGLALLKDFRYTAIDSELNEYIFHDFKKSSKVSLFDNRSIKVLFRSIYELSYSITFVKKLEIVDCKKIMEKFVISNEEYFEDIDFNSNMFLKKISDCKNDSECFLILFNFAKKIKSFNFTL